MSFRLHRKESAEEGVRRIAGAELDRTLAEIAGRELPPDTIVHEARKHCKKLRGLLRLVRPVFAGFRDESDWFRDAARDLSAVRDADVLLATFDHLRERFPEEMTAAAVAALRPALERHRRDVGERCGDVDERLARFAERMRQARQRVASWTLDETGFAAVGAGLELNYRRARRAMQTAYADPTPEHFHAWRKSVKYHWYHMRLLQGLWKQEMQVRRNAAEYLSEFLGADHDLVVLQAALASGAFATACDPHAVQTAADLAERRRRELQATAYPLGLRLFAEKPSRLTERLHRYWQAWRKRRPAHTGPARAAQEVASLRSA